jgi:hypothetical protein
LRPAATSTASESRLRLALGAALFVATLALFAQSIDFEFLSFDARKYVTENPWMTRGLRLESIR